MYSLCVLFSPAQTIGCRPVASLDHFTPEVLGHADLVEEVAAGDGRILKVSTPCLITYLNCSRGLLGLLFLFLEEVLCGSLC